MLKGKNIILGITASIAAYKAAYLVRGLVKEGANVKVVMTPLAMEFITPVTIATLSKNTVLCDFFRHDDGSWNNHVELGIWADLMIIAPATANTMAKMANGVCDNLLLTTYLSARCPVLIAPAMDMDMFGHPATRKNLETLRSFGNIIIEPSSGELASGLHGKGRMEEPDVIIEKAKDFLLKKKRLNGRKFLITAGPTHEYIDPVRYIGNLSSGKMGFAIASCLLSEGANVTVIAGPTSLDIKEAKIIRVVSAADMYKEVMKHAEKMDGIIMAAAVADYTPEKTFPVKQKKKADDLVIKLEPTKDILAELGKKKRKNQLLVGFALETDNELINAGEKRRKKNLDLIVLNSLKDKGAGFNYDTNKVTFIDRSNKIDKFELKSKTDVAMDIVNKIIELS